MTYVMISQTAGQSNPEMETGSETGGVRAYKKYREKERAGGRERKKEWVLFLSFTKVFFFL